MVDVIVFFVLLIWRRDVNWMRDVMWMRDVISFCMMLNVVVREWLSILVVWWLS